MTTVRRRNLRYHLRVPADLTAYITVNPNHSLETPVINISRAGMMISCYRSELAILIPKGAAPAPKHSLDIQVDFSLPLQQQGLVALSMEMRIAYSRRLSKEEFRVGLEFMAPNSQQKYFLEQYIKENGNNLQQTKSPYINN